MKRSLRNRALLPKLLLLSTLLLTGGLSAQDLPQPQELLVERKGETVRGRWKPVAGASYYEVWVKAFGRWSHDKKSLSASPFTSSFELRIADERALYKVRAVGPKGSNSDFSNPVKAKLLAPDEEPSRPTTTTSTGRPSKDPGFDPKAPAPEPPTGLFAIWTDSETIKLVWQNSEGAKNYSVEELIEGKWVSIPRIEFPKKNAAMIKRHPAPGPYKFRVRSIGKNGRASKPSRTKTARR